MINKEKLIVVIVLTGIVLYLLAGRGGVGNVADRQPNLETGPNPHQETAIVTGPSASQGEVILTGLEIPWEIVFLPNGDKLITERSGNLLRIGENEETIPVDGVRHIGEGGLLGVAVHPEFETNNWIYLYLTSEVNGKIINRVEKYVLEEDNLSNREVVIDSIQGSAVHDGGRIKFGPDGYLFITTGDAGNENLAQDRDSLNGKILRLNDDGSIPSDNPFGTPVWSLGHRNPQGLVWDEEGRLWATEHGRSGIRSGYDELNLIEKGKNYGWPIIQGPEEKEGMVSPVIQSGPDTTWAPAGAAFYDGRIYFAGLRGSSLYEYQIGEDRLINHLENKYGRLRAVSYNDSFLYLSTSNTDGRGNPIAEDDRIIKINPNTL
jgi:glucose/arabinose dehydrogenase